MINSMIVEMKKAGGAKSEAISFFEALTSFWRTLYWYVNSDKAIADKGVKELNGFINDRKNRLKSSFPDAGVIYGLFMVLYEKVDSVKFLDAYWEESQARQIMYWMKASSKLTDEQLFTETQTSRDMQVFN